MREALRDCTFQTSGAGTAPWTAAGTRSSALWTPYREIHPAHLAGYLVSERGQFLLTPLPSRRTLLEGTTWYRHHMWPAGYWQLWSDFIIHRIHLRVLGHIKSLAEQDAATISAQSLPPPKRMAGRDTRDFRGRGRQP